MLDNMAPPELRKAIASVRRSPRPVEIEISGGVTPGSIASLAGLGADFVSVGALTHSVLALDISLELK
jgi:nicotinate-nucleotide pyrophosphorylase (carboxylating)